MREKMTPDIYYITVTIDEVDIPKRWAHVVDKSGARFHASFVATTGGIFYIPKKGEQWTAKRQGWIWHLEHRYDGLEEHQWIVDNLEPGDSRIGGLGATTHILSDNVIVSLPDADPGKAGALWNDGGTVKVSSG